MKHHEPTEKLLQKLNSSPLKRYGQNFLVHQETIQKIISAVGLKKSDQILEIGPGLGALTEPMIPLIKSYTSYEIDIKFNDYLRQQYPQGKHHRQSFLKAKPESIDVIVGNLPYYATTEIIEKIYKDFPKTRTIVLMVQKEVLPRLIAKVGDDAYGPLAIFLQTYGKIGILFDVGPECFYPEPHVQSTVFRIDHYPEGPLVETKPFFYFIKKMFLHRRKTILNNLIGAMGVRQQAENILNEVAIGKDLRPEDISVSDYLRLFHQMNQKKLY